MEDKKFAGEAAKENDEKLTEREGGLYSRKRDPRSPFARDYTRILHSMAYRSFLIYARLSAYLNSPTVPEQGPRGAERQIFVRMA